MQEYALGWLPGLEAAAKAAWANKPPIVQSDIFRDVDISDNGFTLANQIRFWTNQGPVGSCFANCITNSIEGSISAAIGDGADFDDVQLSRAWVWYYGRLLDGYLGSRNDGGSITNAMRTVHEYGIPPESVWPYQAEHYALERKPSAAAVAVAKKISIQSMVSLKFDDRDGIKRTIKSKLIPCIGIAWPRSWDYRFDKNAIVQDLSDYHGDAHGLAIIGWKKWKNTLLWHILNSHGPIYPGATSEFREDLTGYADCPTPNKTYAFWCPDSYLQRVLTMTSGELVAPVTVIAPSNRERFSWLQAAA